MERRNYLTDDEEQIIQEDAQRQRAVSLARVARLADTMQNPSQLIDQIRQSDTQALVEKIGRASMKLTALLDQLPPRLHLAATAEIINLPEQGEADTLAVDDEIVPTKTTLEEKSPTATVLPTDWLESVYGEQWQTVLGASDDDDAQLIAIRILNQSKFRESNRSKNIARLVGLIEGKRHTEIAAATEESAVNVYQFSVKIRDQATMRPANALQPATPVVAPVVQAPVIPVRPKPAPPRGTQQFQPVLLAAEQIIVPPTINETINTQPSAELFTADNMKVIDNAVTNPNIISSREWAQAAEASIRVIGEAADLTEAQVDALWAHLHYDEQEAYRAEATADLKAALRPLQRRYASIADLDSRFAKKSMRAENVALRILTTSAYGIKNLDDIHQKLDEVFTSMTKNKSMRVLTRGIVEMYRVS